MKTRLKRLCKKCEEPFKPLGKFCKLCPDCKKINPFWERLLRIQNAK